MDIKIKKIMLGLAPIVIPFAENAINMSLQKINIKLFNDVNNVDDWNEDYIIVDFSTVSWEDSVKSETFDLEIKKKVTYTPKRNLRRVSIEFRYKIKNKWTETYYKDGDWSHKGFWIGQLIDDFIKDNQKVTFKGLTMTDTFNYDRAQQDFMMAQIFIYAYKIPFKQMCFNYADPKWFMGIYGLPWTPSTVHSSKQYKGLARIRNERYKLCTLYFVNNYELEETTIRAAYAMTMFSGVLSGRNRDQLWRTIFVRY